MNLQRILSQSLIIVVIGLASFQANCSKSIFSGGPGASDTGSSIRRVKPDWDYDGRRILGHVGNDIYIWDSYTGRIIQRLDGHRADISTLQFSSDGKLVISSSGFPSEGEFPHTDPKYWPKDTSTRIWDSVTGKELWRLDGSVMGRLSPTGRRLLLFSTTRPDSSEVEMVIWDIATHRRMFTLKSYLSQYGHMSQGHIWNTVTFSKDERTILSYDFDTLTCFDGHDGSILGQIRDVDSFSLFGSDGMFATLSSRGVEIWSEKCQFRKRLYLTKRRGYESEWTQDGGHFVDTRFGKKVNLLSVHDIQLGVDTVVPTAGSGDVLASPDCKHFLLFWGGSDGALIAGYTPLQFSLYDLTGTELWHSLEDVYKPIGFSPDGRTLLIGGGRRFVVYDVESGKALHILDLLGNAPGDGFGNPADQF